MCALLVCICWGSWWLSSSGSCRLYLCRWSCLLCLLWLWMWRLWCGCFFGLVLFLCGSFFVSCRFSGDNYVYLPEHDILLAFNCVYICFLCLLWRAFCRLLSLSGLLMCGVRLCGLLSAGSGLILFPWRS